MCIGGGPVLLTDSWTASMRNQQSTVKLLVQRIIGDFENMPQGMKKSMGPSDVARMQRITRMFELCLQQLAKNIPSNTYEAELPALQEAFMTGAMDAPLFDITEECAVEIDIRQVPEFRDIMTKLAYLVEQQACAEQAALRRPSQTPTESA